MKKVLWVLFVVFLPSLGIFVYLIVRGHGMDGRRDVPSVVRADLTAPGTSSQDADRSGPLRAHGCRFRIHDFPWDSYEQRSCR